jgi:N6-adenosine-specific RNA methylase IME4
MTAEANVWGGLNPPYATIAADPPWKYRQSTRIISTARTHLPVAAANYSTLPVDAVAAFPVADLAAPDAYLFLWATTPLLFGDRTRPAQPAPVDVLEAWGFRYVTMLTWVKRGTLGMGFHFRVDTEHVLVGVRGAAQIPAELRVSNVLVAPKHGHSVKPPALLDVVERVCPGPYVELFARQPRFGWDSWGLGYEGAAP